MLNNSLYSEVYARLIDYMVMSSGGNSQEDGDRARSLINMGQEAIQAERPWEFLQKKQVLSLDSNHQATLPTDFVREILIGSDADSDNVLETFYYRKKDYEITETFSKDTGRSHVITFYSAPSYAVTMVYQWPLPDFTGEGAEYSYFSGDLLLNAAILQDYKETGLTNAEFTILTDAYEKSKKKEIKLRQYNNTDTFIGVNDAAGNQINMSNWTLLG